MVRGLSWNWKQVLSFHFSENAASAKDLRVLLLQTLEAIVSIGLKPAVVVCDQASTNRSLFTALGVSIENPYFKVKYFYKLFYFFSLM